MPRDHAGGAEVETIVGVILWGLANAVYVDMRRRGERGFKRLCAFWLGWPGTLVGMLSVDEGSQPALRRDDGDLRELVREIRQDRMLRGPTDRAGSAEDAAMPERAPRDASPYGGNTTGTEGTT